MRSKHHSNQSDRFKGWRCDSCAGMITSVQAGWVEWLASEDKHGNDILRGLRLVHRGHQKDARNHKCRYDPLGEFRSGKTIVEGLPLERLVGADGLMVLLSFLAEGELPHGEILELIKRVQIRDHASGVALRRRTRSNSGPKRRSAWWRFKRPGR